MTKDEAIVVMTNAATKRKPESRARVKEALSVLEPKVTPPLGPKQEAQLEARIETEQAKADKLAENAKEAADRAAEAAAAAKEALAAQKDMVKSLSSPTPDEHVLVGE